MGTRSAEVHTSWQVERRRFGSRGRLSTRECRCVGARRKFADAVLKKLFVIFDELRLSRVQHHEGQRVFLAKRVETDRFLAAGLKLQDEALQIGLKSVLEFELSAGG